MQPEGCADSPNSFGDVRWSWASVLVTLSLYQVLWNLPHWRYLALWPEKNESLDVQALLNREYLSLILSLGIKVVVVILIFVLFCYSKSRWTSIGISFLGERSKLFLVALLTLWTLVLGYSLNAALEIHGPQKSTFPDAPPITKNLVLLNLFFRGLCGPACEEIIFRAFLFLSVRRYLGPKWGVFLSGLIFGLAHYNGGITQIVFTFSVGLLLCYFYGKTKSLPQVILLHSSMNIGRHLLALARGHL